MLEAYVGPGNVLILHLFSRPQATATAEVRRLQSIRHDRRGGNGRPSQWRAEI